MPDTGPPWNIPYVEPTDNPRVYPAASEDLAEAIADGLDAAGGLVAVKSALFTGTQSASVLASDNLAVTNLSITHTLAAATNKLIISAYLGAAANSLGRGNVGIAVADNGTLFAIGDAVGSRTRVAAGCVTVVESSGSLSTQVVTMPSITVVYEPGDTSSHTYTVRAINIDGSTRTLYINRSDNDSNSAALPRATSGLIVQEVKV